MNVDTRLIPMQLAPGERVDVTPSGDVGGGGSKTLMLSPIRSKDFFTGEMVREMVYQINEWVKDGGTGVTFVRQS